MVSLSHVHGGPYFHTQKPDGFGVSPWGIQQVKVKSSMPACARCRFPIGGESISVTSGVVSRIEVTAYVHGSAELLGVQIDAAINSGNSGGPAFNARGQCVGIAFQSLKVLGTSTCGICCCLAPPVP